eukprot:SAG22_NODE_6387_length_863_cov_0.941099_1_plen_76_part_00
MLRRERPKLLFDKDRKPTHLYNGAIAPCRYKGGDLGCSPHDTVRSSTIVVPLNVPANRGGQNLVGGGATPTFKQP